MCRAAGAACPDAVSKREVVFYETTNAAGFAGRIPLIDFGKGLSLRCEFILKHRAEHTEAIIVCGFTKLQGTSQTAQVDVFHKYSIILLGYRSTYRMAEVLALIGYMFMQKLNFMQLFVIIFRARFHTRQLALLFCEFLFTLTIELRIVGHFAVAVNIKVMGRII